MNKESQLSSIMREVKGMMLKFYLKMKLEIVPHCPLLVPQIKIGMQAICKNLSEASQLNLSSHGIDKTKKEMIL